MLGVTAEVGAAVKVSGVIVGSAVGEVLE